MNVDWSEFEKRTVNSVKLYNVDRIDFSKSEARSTLYCGHSLAMKHNVDNVDTKYVSTKRFNNTQVQKQFNGANYAYKINTVQSNKTKSNSPFEPTKQVVDASYCNIKPGSNCVYLGKAPFKTGARPSFATYNKGHQLDAAKSVLMPKPYRASTVNNIMLNGGWINARQQFERFCDGKKNIPISYNKNLKLLKKYSDRIGGLPSFERPTKAHMYYIPLKYDASCGGETDNYFKTKGSGLASALPTAFKLWDEIHTKRTRNFSVYTLGGKEKAVRNKQNDTRIQSRLLYQQDFVEFLVAKPYIKKIEDWLFANDSNPIVIGKDITGMRSMRLLGNFTKWKYNIEFDWAGWDSTVISEKIALAFATFRGMFPESTEIDNAFIYFCDGMINKYTVAPDGNLFKVTRGMPSGSGWTTLINSMVNALIMEEILSQYAPFVNKQASYQVSGDDGNIFFDDVISFKPSKLISFCKKRYDMDIEITYVGKCISDHPDDSATFNKLCYYWNDGFAVATVQPKLLAKRLSLIQKEGNTFKTFVDSLIGNIPQCIVHKDCVAIMCAYWYHYKLSKSNRDEAAISLGQFRDNIEQTTDELFNQTKDEVMVRSNSDGGGKKMPFEIIKINFPKVDQNFVDNWLIDNTEAFRNFKVSKESRFIYLTKMTGVRVAVHWFYNEQSKFIDNVDRWGLRIKNINEIITNRNYWYELEKKLRKRMNVKGRTVFVD